MKADEYNYHELRRVMIEADKLDDAIEDLDPDVETDQEREDLYDARYHAHKLRVVLLRLAKAAKEANEA